MSVYRAAESSERETDAELLAAALVDPEAFGRFYDRYEAAVAGYFMRRTGVPEVAADLTAEVFADALAAAARYRPDGPTAAMWLFAIARNKLSNSMRRGRVEARARRRAGVERVELHEDGLARLAAAEGDRWVVEMLDGLPVEQREAIRARVLNERDYQDIAGELRASELVVRKRVSRGLAKLRQRLRSRHDPARALQLVSLDRARGPSERSGVPHPGHRAWVRRRHGSQLLADTLHTGGHRPRRTRTVDHAGSPRAVDQRSAGRRLRDAQQPGLGRDHRRGAPTTASYKRYPGSCVTVTRRSRSCSQTARDASFP